MKTRRFVLSFALLCFSGLAKQLSASTLQMPQSSQMDTFLPVATTLPTFQIAFIFCLGAVLLWTMLWVSVLKMVRLEALEPVEGSF